MISPCANILRRIVHEFHNSLGEDQGTKHCTADLAKDIGILTTSILEHKIYEDIPGRASNDAKHAPVDIISKGYRTFAHGVPRDSIGEFNVKFRKLQRRSELAPLADDSTA